MADRANGVGSVGSRSLFVGGTAVAVSTNDMINKAREKASNVLETSIEDIEYHDGWLTVELYPYETTAGGVAKMAYEHLRPMV